MGNRNSRETENDLLLRLLMRDLLNRKRESQEASSTGTIQEPSPLVCNWESVIGQVEAKEAIEGSFFLPRKFPDFYGLQDIVTDTDSADSPTSSLGLLQHAKRRLLFWGPPGTGKTMLAHALATAHEAKFVSFSPGNVSKWVGETEKEIRKLFEQAKVEKTVIFFDEIDSFGASRESKDPNYVRTTMNQLLMSIDDFGKHVTVDSVFVACTNMYHHLDDALLRRFDAHIFCGLPTVKEKAEMLKFHLKNTRYELTQEQITDIALRAEYFSGSDIERLCSTAAMEPANQLQRSEYFLLDAGTGKYRPSMVETPESIRKSIKELEFNSLERARPIYHCDFLEALLHSKPTIDGKAYQKYLILRSQNVDDATNTRNAQDPDQEELNFIFDTDQLDSVYASTSIQLERFTQMATKRDSMVASEYRFYCGIPLLVFLLFSIISFSLLYVLWFAIAVIAFLISVTSYIWPLYEHIQSFRHREKDNMNWTKFMDSIIFMVLLTSLMLFGKLTGELPLINVSWYWFIDVFPVTFFLYTLFMQVALLLQFYTLKVKYLSKNKRYK